MTADDPQVGSVADEAAKLLGALQDWARDTRSVTTSAMTDALGAQLGGLSDHVAHGDDCRYCPLCRVIRAFRETSPEVRGHLAAAAGSFAQAVSAHLNASTTREQTPRASTQSIDLDDE